MFGDFLMKKSTKKILIIGIVMFFVFGFTTAGILIATDVLPNPFDKQTIVVIPDDDNETITYDWLAFNFTWIRTSDEVEDAALYTYTRDTDGLTAAQITATTWSQLTLDDTDSEYESGTHIPLAQYDGYIVAFMLVHADAGTYYIKNFDTGMNYIDLVNCSSGMQGSAISEDLSESTLANCTEAHWNIYLRADSATNPDFIVGYDNYKLDLPEGNTVYNFTIIGVGFNCTPQYNFADMPDAYDEILDGTTNTTYFLIQDNIYNDITSEFELNFNDDLINVSFNCTGATIYWGNLDTSKTTLDTIA